ncbi:MAG: phosphoribosylformylglycinamidine cyclo-ligase [Longimicrobiales bacterium]
MQARPGLTYRAAGVDRDAADRAKHRIIELMQGTATAGALSQPGGFGGLFRVPTGYASPVLVASADGVGTKLKVAVRAGRHDTVGVDIVNHCVNDILVEGARPLFFLDYIGMGRLDAATVEQIVEGVSAACLANECALIGGETAELPDLYAPGEYDLAGFVVGVVEEQARPGPQRVRAGDRLIALASAGFHTNGYSLLRRIIFDELGLGTDDEYPGTGHAVAETLLRPHRSYRNAVLPLIEDGAIHALAHITGGGIPDNLERVLPDGAVAIIERASWTPPPEFAFIMEAGRVERTEMEHTFNMGVGMIAIVAAEREGEVLTRLSNAGEHAWTLGRIEAGTRGVVLR